MVAQTQCGAGGDLHGPALTGGHGEEGEEGPQHVVVVEEV